MESERADGGAPAQRDEPGGIAIEARGLTRRFGKRTALDALDLDIPANQTFGLMGANGAGKTTFIRLVTGFLLPDDGSILVGGYSPTRDPRAVKQRLGFAMETSRLYPELRVRGFLRFMGGTRGLEGTPLAVAVDRAIEQFQLHETVGRQIGNLSKGLQQRVSLAQAFLHDPPLVIVDEPTGGLDPVQRGYVQDVLESLRGNRTVLLCTHDLEEARRLTSQVAVLEAGRLVAHGPTDEVLCGDDLHALFRPREDAPS
ncbi:MAG: ABC transporter ATP-binding protein [Deltaproteobacteria bacterium]|nr:ABC transporter ATP-binding protein [Deltaproteobacteria bacterium]